MVFLLVVYYFARGAKKKFRYYYDVKGDFDFVCYSFFAYGLVQKFSGIPGKPVYILRVG